MWSCWSKNVFFEGFGVPGGCKSILIIKKSIYIVYNKTFWTEGFIFLDGQKKWKKMKGEGDNWPGIWGNNFFFSFLFEKKKHFSTDLKRYVCVGRAFTTLL